MAETNIDSSPTLAIAISPKFVHEFCNFCLSKVSPKAAKRCSGCQFVYYCCVECQKRDWTTTHRLECGHLKGKSEKWRNAESADLATEAHLLLRLLVAYDHLPEHKGTFSKKTFATLMTHVDDMKNVENAQLRTENERAFRSSKTLVDYLMGTIVPEERFTEVYMKVKVNSIDVNVWDVSLRESQAGIPTPIGASLDLDISSLDHSCRPNVQIFADGRTLRVVPLGEKVGEEEMRISYTVLSAPRAIRRWKLKNSWYFRCECDRCRDDGEERVLSGVKCSACDHMIPLTDVQLCVPFDIESAAGKKIFNRALDRFSPQVRKAVMQILQEIRASTANEKKVPTQSIICLQCQKEQSAERVAYACALMKFVAIVFNFSDLLAFHLATDGVNGLLSLQERSSLCEFLDAEFRAYVPESNVFYARLQLEMAFYTCDINASRKADYLLRWYAVASRCYPTGHFVLFRYQLPLCQTLVQSARYDEAETVLVDLEKAVKSYFRSETTKKTEERCPFAKQLRLFRRCVENRASPASVLRMNKES